MKQWVVKYWKHYAPVVNRISVRSLLAIESIHEFPSISNDFLIAFNQADLDMYVFMEITLGMGVNGNI